MRKIITKKLEKIIVIVLAFSLLFSTTLLMSPTEVKAATTTTWLPIMCYTNTTSNVTTYTSSSLSKSTGYICSGDLCTITNIYSNGAVQVKYPVSGGKYKTAYASSKNFFNNINFSTATTTLGKNLTVYRKSSGSNTIGTVYASDSVMVCGTANGRTQILYPAGSSWKLGWVSGTYPVNSDHYMIVTALKDSMVLDVDGNSTKNGANVQIYQKSDNNAAEIFYVESLGNGYYRILNSASGKALDVSGGVKKSGVNVQMYEYNGTDSQIWEFIDAGNGYFYIKNKLGYMLDVSGGKTANKTNVQVYEKNNTNSQKWKFVKVNVGTQRDSLEGYIINGVDIGYKAGSYFTDNGKACTDHNKSGIHSFTNENACNCICTYNGKSLGAVQCFGFARYIQTKLYGKNSYDAPNSFYKISGSNIAAGKLTASKMKSLVQSAGVGAHIRTGGSQHSMIITDITNDGFTIIQCNGSNNKEYTGYSACRIGTYTYTWSSYVNSTYGKRGLNFIEKMK